MKRLFERSMWPGVLLGLIVATLGLLGAGRVANAFPFNSGLGEHHGFFLRQDDSWGDSVIEEGLNPNHSATYTRTNFTNDVYNALYRTGNKTAVQNPVGAAFIIITMLGYDQGDRAIFGNTPAQAIAFARANYTDWRDNVVIPLHQAGRIQYNASYTYTRNTYWQGNGQGSNPNDVAWYTPGTSTDRVIRVSDFSGNVYAIKHDCGNPVGTMDRLVPRPNFNINGHVRATNNATGQSITGTGRGGGARNIPVAQGSTVNFQYYTYNQGVQSTSPLTITSRARNATANTVLNTDSRVIPAGPVGAPFYTEVNFSIPAAAAVGTTYCRTVSWTPSSQTSSAESTSGRVCAVVTASSVGGNCMPVSSSVANLEAGTATTLTFGYEGISPAIVGSPPPPTGNLRITIPTAPATIQNIPISYTLQPGGTEYRATRNYTPPINGTYRIEYTISLAGLSACNDEFNVSSRPYVKVFGGDVKSGVSFGPSCTDNAQYHVLAAYNRGSGAGYAGSGTSHASYAMDVIDGFASGVGATNPNVGDPRKLAFANTDAANTFGGEFKYAPCTPDYWALKGTAAPLTANTVIGQNPANASNPIPNPQNVIVGPGAKQDIFVDGSDVYIRGNVLYDDGTAWNLGNVPSYRVIVNGGNIYIHPDVTELNGLFVALPDSTGSKGVIYTCALGFTPPTAAEVADRNACGKAQLKVYGAFVAQQVKLLRTFGTVSAATTGDSIASSNAAEVFVYSPAVWLGIPASSVNTGNSFDAITSLPPIL